MTGHTTKAVLAVDYTHIELRALALTSALNPGIDIMAYSKIPRLPEEPEPQIAGPVYADNRAGRRKRASVERKTRRDR